MPLSRHQQDIIQRRIEEIQTVGRGMTKWETDFVDSVSEQFERTRSISQKQDEILDRIYAERTPL